MSFDKLPHWVQATIFLFSIIGMVSTAVMLQNTFSI